MKYILFPACLVLLLAACGNKGKYADASATRIAHEEAAALLLDSVRASAAAGHYALAFEQMARLREQFPYAFDARETAILLADSIHLQRTREALDSLAQLPDRESAARSTRELEQQLRFYQRKLEYDRNGGKGEEAERPA